MRGVALLGTLALALTACAEVERHEPLANRGAELARDPSVSRSRYNSFACLTCHAERVAGGDDRILPGAPLEGATRRPMWWGGEVVHLREAVERCWTHFMKGNPRDLDGPSGEAIFAYLSALSPEGEQAGTAAVPMSFPARVVNLGRGDATRGAALYRRACGYCHAPRDQEAGRLSSLVSVIPRDTIREHCMQTRPQGVGVAEYLRAVTVEKVRHGSFLGYAGSMPPYATQVLSDAQIADILAYLDHPDRC